MTGTSRMEAPVDILSCEREQIHIPGAIQPHGVLLALHPADLRIIHVSANYRRFFPKAEFTSSERLFDRWAGDENRDVLESLLQVEEASYNPLRFRDLVENRITLGTVHRANDLIMLELEHETEPPAPSGGLLRMRRAASRLEGVKSQQDLFEVVVDEIHLLCGYDRVMLYRFADDWHGEVVAERVNSGVDAYLGLHYPASDIPSQARELYRTNWLRYIPDVNYTPAALQRLPEDPVGRPLDLSNAYLRSVSPVHIEYLHNMGVAATLTVSVIQNGHLWGLIALHHRLPRQVSYETRLAAEFFGRIASLQLSAIQEREALRYRIACSRTRDRLVARLGESQAQLGSLATDPDELLGLTQADGAAIVAHDLVISVGKTPPDEGVREISDWVCSSVDQDVFITSALSLEHKDFERWPQASGMLATVVSRNPNICVLWFREEFPQSVSWGGNPNKAVELNSNGRISPRRSFERWNEMQKLRANPWSLGAGDAAREFHTLLASAFARRASLLEKSNADLSYANRELDEFAHIASHDLKEPLRGIHNYASYLIDDYADLLDEEGRDKLNTLVRLTQRMDSLIESLLQLSRFGRVDFEHGVTDLEAVIGQVLELFGPRIEGRHARVQVETDFPPVRADAVRIAEVFNNLISNSLKYSEKPEPYIKIGYLPLGENDTRVTIFVKDDGIGIPERHLRTVFQMFKRLHPVDGYGGGTGAGLALALRIVERHNGTMWIDSEPKKGTTMFFTLELVR